MFFYKIHDVYFQRILAAFSFLEVETWLEEDERDECLQLILNKSEGRAEGLLKLEVKYEDGRLDKGPYATKDRVKFRVVLSDHNLKPPYDLEYIDEIFVEYPRNMRTGEQEWRKVVREFMDGRERVQREFIPAVRGAYTWSVQDSVQWTLSGGGDSLQRV